MNASRTTSFGSPTEKLSVAYTARPGEAGALEVTYDGDADGVTDLTISTPQVGVVPRSYTYSIPVTRDNQRALIGATGGRIMLEGEVVSVTLTQARVDEMHRAARGDSYVFEGDRRPDQVVRARNEFAQSIARGWGPSGRADGLIGALVRHGDGQRLPGEVVLEMSDRSSEVQARIEAREAAYARR